MTHYNTSLQHEWWKNLQQLNIDKVEQIVDLHPELIWTKIPTDINIMSTFNVESAKEILIERELGTCFDDLNSLQWLLLCYHEEDAKRLIPYLLSKASTEELSNNNNNNWGDYNSTTLHIISALGYIDLAQLWLDIGAPTNIANNRGCLPSDVAQTDAMIKLLNSNHDDKILTNEQYSTTINTTHRLQQQQQQQQQQHSMGSQVTSMSSTGTGSVLITPNKDQHYFRQGHVEQTKQKVLTEEQVELEKQRERRRKDIAILAKRSAVKNNPFVKNLDPSLATTSRTTNTLSDDTMVHDGSTVGSSMDDTVDDRKPKRNSKVINSLQTKSYVSSSVFRQGQSSVRIKNRSKHPQPSLPTKDQSERIPSPDTTAINGSLGYSGTIDDSMEENDIDSLLQDDTQSSTSTPDSTITHSPSYMSSTISPSSTMTPSVTPANETNSDDANNDNMIVSHCTSKVLIEKEMDAETEITQSLSKTAITSSPTTTTSTISTKKAQQKVHTKSNGQDIDNRRLSGSQKSHWSKELTSWVSALDREFSLLGDDHRTDSETTMNNLVDTKVEIDTLVPSNNLKKDSPLSDSDDGDDNISSNSSSSSSSSIINSNNDKRKNDNGKSNNNNGDENKTHHKQVASHKPDKEHQRRGLDGTIFESTRLPLKSYGSVSVRSTATYSRRLPTFDVTSAMSAAGTNSNKSAVSLPPLENDSVVLKGTTSSTPTQQDRRNPLVIHNDNHYKMTRSMSGSALSSSVGIDHHHSQFHQQEQQQQQKQQQKQQKQYPPQQQYCQHHHHHQQRSNQVEKHQMTANLPPSINLPLSNNTGHGKLYVRVNGVHDVLLPLPREQAHVRCVIGDGRYEYMSRYETLGHNITFGYECIIDSHPDMIVTLSLHVRPDYMLKKPLSRLFTTHRKRKGSLSAYVSSEDGAVGQTRFAISDMLAACHRRSASVSFHCFNAWYVHSRDKSSSSRQQELDQGVLKVIGNFEVELLYLPVSNPSLPVPKNLRECDMAIKIQQWNDTCFDTDHYPKKIHRPQPRVA